ncbi:MAG: hypothetical protein LUQ19_04865, partial [Methanoregula sp.]|nr:hypothetical protein [Methanoregula sp.]
MAPQKPAGRSGKALLIAGVVVVLLIAGVYFIGLPMLGGTKSAGAGTPVPTVPTQQPMVTLTAVMPTMTQNTQNTVTPGAIQTYEERYTESYNEVYSINQPFAGGQKAVFTQNLIKPPLYIKFNITPVIHTEEKRVDIGMPSERI